MQTTNFQHGDRVEVRAGIILKWSPQCFFTLSIRDEEISIHLDRPEEIIKLGERLQVEGERLQAEIDAEQSRDRQAEPGWLPVPF